MSVIPPLSAVAPARRGSLTRVFERAFSFPVLLGAILARFVFEWVRVTSPDSDSWWHIAAGAGILESGRLPISDPYSFTAGGTSWMAYEWLGDVLFAAATRSGDLVPYKGFQFILAVAFAILLYQYVTLRCGRARAAFVTCLLLWPLTFPFFNLRPQLLGYGFLIIELTVLELFRRGNTRPLWVLPFLYMIWVNTHGSFALGLAVLCLYWACSGFEFQRGAITAERTPARQRVQLLGVVLLSMGAALVTPYGTRLFSYPLELALHQPVNVASIQEWQPVGTDYWFLKIFVAVLAIFFTYLLACQPSIRLFDLSLLVFASLSATLHLRFLIVFAVALAPLVAELFVRLAGRPRSRQDHPILNAVFMLALAAVSWWQFPNQERIQSIVEKAYPVHAVQYLRSHSLPGPLLNEYDWGGYLIGSGFAEERKIFIDGRADIYEYSGVLQDYFHLTRLERPPMRILDRYAIQTCLVRQESAIANFLRNSSHWKEVYRDDLSAVFSRTPTS